MNSGQLPPHDHEAEMSLLGSLMVGGYERDVLMSGVYANINAADFFLPKHQAIFKAISKINDQGAVDLVLLWSAVKDSGLSEDIGGVEYLVELVDGVPESMHAPHYAAILKQKSRLRRAINVAERCLEDCYKPDANTVDIIDNLVGGVSGMQADADRGEPELVGPIIDRVWESIQAMEPGKFPGLKIGLPSVDDFLCGVSPTDLIIIGARPSIGKSALATTMAEAIAKQGKGVLFFSLEMGRDQHGIRILSSISGVPMGNLRSNELSGQDVKDVNDAREKYNEMEIVIDDTPSIKPSAIRRIVRQVKDKHNIAAIFIDYMQIMAPDRQRENRNAEVGSISRGLKAIAKEFETPVFALCQLNRHPSDGPEHLPTLSRLRESGDIEQDADAIMLLHRPGYWKSHTGSPSDATVIIAKQRQGPTGQTKNIDWDGDLCRFHDSQITIESEGDAGMWGGEN